MLDLSEADPESTLTLQPIEAPAEVGVTEAVVPEQSPLAGEQVRRLEQLCENEVTAPAVKRSKRCSQRSAMSSHRKKTGSLTHRCSGRRLRGAAEPKVR